MADRGVSLRRAVLPTSKLLLLLLLQAKDGPTNASAYPLGGRRPRHRDAADAAGPHRCWARGPAPAQRVRWPHAAGRQSLSHHVHFRARLGQRAKRAVPQG